MGGVSMKEMWIARDKNNKLFLFTSPKLPEKEGERWITFNFEYVELDNNLFPEIQWSDKKPTKVKLVIEK